ncbi:hypothetical protein [Marinoscillum sp.]|uniref:hypothetical protein n=1 Tax=Marinoscillum sp. TaxID=2024838 RepID=UPI003BAA9CE5
MKTIIPAQTGISSRRSFQKDESIWKALSYVSTELSVTMPGVHHNNAERLSRLKISW